MSHAQTQEHTSRKARKVQEVQGAQEASAEPTNQEPTMTQDSSNGTDSSVTEDAHVKVHFDKADLTVDLPRRYRAGMPLTADQANILDAAVMRQFTNNMNANAKARAERLAKATAENDAAGIAANQPYTAEEVVSLYVDYQPQVGGGPRMGSLEKMRRDAAWNAWVQLLADHNAAIDAGETPILNTSNKQSLITAPRKSKDVSDDQHAANVEKFQTQKDSFIDRILSLPKYAARVQVELDKLQAQRGVTKTEAKAPPVATLDVIA